MTDTLVYSTSTVSARRHRDTVLAIERVHRAHLPVTTRRRPVGACMVCGAVEVRLDNVTGHRDLSDMGESSHYPVGYGCEVCS